MSVKRTIDIPSKPSRIAKAKAASRDTLPTINLNLNVRGLPQSATLAINERSAELAAQGKRIFKLGLGQSPFPVPRPIVEELKENAHRKEYQPVKGVAELREAVARYHERSQGIHRQASDVMIGPGSKELMFILQLVYYGDLVIPTPSWVSYAPQAHIIGRHIHWLPTHGSNNWRLMPDEIQKLCKKDPGRPRLIVLNYPANPTGGSYTVDELAAIADVARKYRVVLLSDEIYGELHHTGEHVSIARFYPEGTVIASGLSKWCGAGGWRLGTFAFPRNLRWLQDAMAVVASETYTSTSAPIQYAAVRAFQGGDEIERYLVNARRILAHLGGSIAEQLQKTGVNVALPEGAFYLFPDFGPLKERLHAQGITTSEGLCEHLIEETGVAILPGSVFGRKPEELTARLAYVDFDGARALTASHASRRDGLAEDFLGTYCGDVVEAIDRLCDWLQK
jgi:aspartate aminotransferase